MNRLLGPALFMTLIWLTRQPCLAIEQLTINRVEQMPNLPVPFAMRDWNKVTRDYVAFVFDFDRRGEYLPVIRWRDEGRTVFTMPSSVGAKGGPEAINTIAAVVSGALVDIDMTRYGGHNLAAMCTNFFGPDGVYANGLHGRTGGSFWYDVFPNVLFYQLRALYPGSSEMDRQARSVAEKWYAACVAMGGKADPPALPNINHTAFKLQTLTPVDNGQRTEPEAAAGIAWFEYMAWREFRDPRFLAAADWMVRALEQRPVEQNPLYEVLVPYGALLAARMNAELDRSYDVPKILNWCFEPRDRPQARPWWGVIADRFGNYDCHGLIGSVKDTDGYAFAMNTFQYAGALVPLARYDARYARAVGKWMLNLANASRLFYPNALPAEHQDNRAWPDKYDPNYCIAYEGLRNRSRASPHATGDPMSDGSGPMNLGLYGSSHVGILGGIIARTSDEKILQLDCLKTDYYHDKAYPTFLYYNPHVRGCNVRITVGTKTVDLYDAVTHRFVRQNVNGRVAIPVAKDAAALIVVAPAGGKVTRMGRKLLVDGIVVDYHAGR